MVLASSGVAFSWHAEGGVSGPCRESRPAAFVGTERSVGAEAGSGPAPRGIGSRSGPARGKPGRQEGQARAPLPPCVCEEVESPPLSPGLPCHLFGPVEGGGSDAVQAGGPGHKRPGSSALTPGGLGRCVRASSYLA